MGRFEALKITGMADAYTCKAATFSPKLRHVSVACLRGPSVLSAVRYGDDVARRENLPAWR